ncbi:hypothetical protein GCM10011586_36310 [Silvibacterium dinghuense]|nr:hypothetical protein GCM10011586_36310 [Silvibacterium dinghuense]
MSPIQADIGLVWATCVPTQAELGWGTRSIAGACELQVPRLAMLARNDIVFRKDEGRSDQRGLRPLLRLNLHTYRKRLWR